MVEVYINPFVTLLPILYTTRKPQFKCCAHKNERFNDLMYLNDSQNGQNANSYFLGFILHAKIERYCLLSLRSKSKNNKQAFGPIFFQVLKYYEALLGFFMIFFKVLQCGVEMF